MDAQLRFWLPAALCAALLAGAGLARAQLPAKPDPHPTGAGDRDTHSRLRHCAVEWGRMKRTGEASGKIWRDFWEVCGKR